MNQTPHHLARMQPDVDRITAERDRLKTALGRVFAAARYMSLDHPVEAAAIFAAMGAPADGLAETGAAGMSGWADLFGIDPDFDTITEEPKQLLAVVEEKGERRRRWFRWSYDSHSGFPWQLMGTVHVDDEEKDHSRWADLPKVRLISDGVPVCGCASCGGPR